MPFDPAVTFVEECPAGTWGHIGVSSVSVNTGQFSRLLDFDDADALEDFRPVALCNVPQFGFV